MACTSCDGTTTNNANSTNAIDIQGNLCPNRMDYGWLTDYNFRCAQNAKLNAAVPPNKNAYMTRMYLQNNAVKIMEQERLAAESRLAPCAPCKRPNSEQGTMLPEKYVVRCDGATCETVLNNPNGLGVGRGF